VRTAARILVTLTPLYSAESPPREVIATNPAHVEEYGGGPVACRSFNIYYMDPDGYLNWWCNILTA